MPQQDTSRVLSSTLSEMSVTSGGTAPKGWSAGGSCSVSAGSAGISITLVAVILPLPSSGCQSQTLALRSAVETTTPTKPHGLLGSCAGRSSSTICCSGPRSMACWCVRLRMSQTWRWWPYLPPSRSSGLTPASTMFGVPHSLVTMRSKPMFHQMS